jgi:dTDP-4-dehydrorhamnose 3,5-epimerase
VRPLSFLPTDIPGCVEVLCQRSDDLRGSFSKILHEDRFTESLLPGHFAEWYHTFSHHNVLRGLHFQGPEKAQGKLVFCLAGRVLDVGVDLRVGSPTYGRHIAVELTAEAGNGLYLPPGIAHGYCVINEEGATMLYGATEVYHPAADGGIAWDSAGIAWPTDAPILSDRDRELPALADYASPFTYEGAR